jgi:alpha-L-fucosidase
MDWHHPDGARCAYDPVARRRFLDFTQGCVCELMSHYGKIDVLWYDVPRPFQSHEGWESLAMNQMVRKLQPHILINDRSRLPEDFSTPEETVKAAEAGRGWEACMTFNQASWGWMPSAAIDAYSARDIIKMLNTACCGAGNLLLNIGPSPEGDVPAESVEPLTTVGRWLKQNGEAVYGKAERGPAFATACGDLSKKGKKLYLWTRFWPGKEIGIGGFETPLKSARFLVGGKAIAFEQKGHRIILKNLPPKSPDKLAGITLIELDFAADPVYTKHAVAPALFIG